MNKLLKKIDQPRMVGDREHNRYIDILFSDVDKRKKYYKDVTSILNQYLEDSSQNWIFLIFNQRQIKKFNSLMKSKTEKTYIKRLRGIIDDLTSGRYDYLFNKEIVDSIKEYKDNI